jgi:large subunit ribosomal protein L6
MSKIGKKPIQIPEGVEIKIEERVVKVKGPKGELSLEIRPEIGINIKDNQIEVFPKNKTKQTKALWGTTRSLINNLVEGVTKGFQKQLEIQGIGYKANLEGRDLILEVGFSHPVRMKIPQGLEVSVSKNIITVTGIDKQLVGEFAAQIRKVRPPEPYKGKGIRYLGEKIKLKPGKKAVGAQ